MSGSSRMGELLDLVADGDLHYRSEAGTPGRVRVKVGRPRHLSDVPGDDWLCPLWMEGVTDEVKCFEGAGPVDSLLKAMSWVDARLGELERSPS